MEARQAKNKMKQKTPTKANYVAIASTRQEIQNDVAMELNSPPQETIVKSLNRSRESLQKLFRTYLLEKIFQFPKHLKILLFPTKEKMNPKNSSFLP